MAEPVGAGGWQAGGLGEGSWKADRMGEGASFSRDELRTFSPLLDLDLARKPFVGGGA